MRSVFKKITSAPIWFVLPAIAVVATVAYIAAGYVPLVFDPSAYSVPSALASDLSKVDAEALESAAASAEEQPEQIDTQAAVAAEGLRDGTWTGYAACGQGNSEGWKPYYVAVTITIQDGAVVAITDISGTSTADSGQALTWDAAENQKYLSQASSGVRPQLEAQFPLKGSLSGIDVVSGATYSSDAIYRALANAISKASTGASVGSAAAPMTTAKTASSKAKPLKQSVKKKTPKVGKLKNGTWTAYAKCGPDPAHDWKPYYVAVTITVKGGKVTDIKRVVGSSKGAAGSPKLTWDAAENQQYLDGAIAGVVSQIKRALKAGKTPTTVDVVSGATYSSKAIFDAFYAALKRAAKAGGLTVKKPKAPTTTTPSTTSTGGDTSQPLPAADVYYGYALCGTIGSSEWDPYYLFVAIEAPDGMPTKILRTYPDESGIVDPTLTYSAGQNASYLSWAVDGKFGGVGYRMKSVVKQIQEKLDEGSEPTRIDTVSGATISSRAIFAAYQMAAAHAAAGTGTTPEDAVAAEAANNGEEDQSDTGA